MKLRSGNATRAWVDYVFALLAVAVATGLRLAMDPWIGPEAEPYVTFSAAVAVVAFLWGRNPGLVATFVGGVACDYFVIPPRHTWLFMSPVETVPMAFYWATGVLVSILAGHLRAARQVAEQRARALRESEASLARAQMLAHLANWELHVGTNAVRGSSELYRLFDLPADAAWDAYLEKSHPEDTRRVVESVHNAIHGGRPYSIDYRIVPGPGVVRYVHAEGEVTRDGNGRPITLFGTVQDITERKRLERERDALLESEHEARGVAERAARAKDEFLATVSHELRNPLTSILAWLGMLRRGVLRPDEVSDAHGEIEKSARLLNRLIEDLLDTSRIVAGKLKVNLEPTDVAAVAREVVAMFQPAAQAKPVSLEGRFGQDAPARCDPVRLKQLIGNLLSNAVKFTPAGGRVQVRVARSREHVLIAVRDTGIGIPPEFLPHLFERFRQADTSTAREYRGLGLGLALVKHLTELHGGTVRARSKGSGRGALFVVRLPLLDTRRLNDQVQREAEMHGDSCAAGRAPF